jgi:hypothetical protein
MVVFDPFFFFVLIWIAAVTRRVSQWRMKVVVQEIGSI